MNCTDFLAHHSEYVDGRAEPHAAMRMAAHVDACGACARYDRVVRKGGQLVRDVLPRVHASDHFEPRLRHRLLHVRDEMARPRTGAGTVYAAASVVVLVAAAAAMAFAQAGDVVADAPVAYATPATPVASRAYAVAAGPSIPVGAAPAVAPIDADAVGQDSHIAAVAAWPVYSKSAAAVAFPSPHTVLAVTPAEFRYGSRAAPAPLLVRH